MICINKYVKSYYIDTYSYNEILCMVHDGRYYLAVDLYHFAQQRSFFNHATVAEVLERRAIFLCSQYATATKTSFRR